MIYFIVKTEGTFERVNSDPRRASSRFCSASQIRLSNFPQQHEYQNQIEDISANPLQIYNFLLFIVSVENNRHHNGSLISSTVFFAQGSQNRCDGKDCEESIFRFSALHKVQIAPDRERAMLAENTRGKVSCAPSKASWRGATACKSSATGSAGRNHVYLHSGAHLRGTTPMHMLT